MASGFDAEEITPGLAIAAAELFHYEKPDSIVELAEVVDAELFTASSIQLALMVIDWISLSEAADALAVAYEEDDQESIDALAKKGARFEVDENGTLNSWMESPSEEALDFPLEFWTRIKLAIEYDSEAAALLLGIPVEAINHIAAGIVNDGIIKLLSGENEIEIPTAIRFFGGDVRKANHAVVATNAFITALVIKEAAKSRTYALRETLEESEEVTYEDVADVIRDSLRDEMLRA